MAVATVERDEDREVAVETGSHTDRLPDPLAELGTPGLVVEHVLVPLDGTKLSLSALPTAHALADRVGAEVHAISVVEDPATAASRLNVGRVAVESEPGEDRVTVITGTDPAAGIVRRAEQLGSCAVVMSTNARGRLGGAVLGSVARSVLTQVGPIVALGPVADRPMWSPPPVRWPPPLSVDRMVACVDGSPESEAVLPVAAAWAKKLGMSLSILMFIEDAPEPLRVPSGPPRFGATNDPHEYLRDLALRWHSPELETDSWVLREPIGPGTGIRLHLADHPAGLVAVSTAARSGLRRFLRGSAADKIVRASVVPCLVVPQGSVSSSALSNQTNPSGTLG